MGDSYTGNENKGGESGWLVIHTKKKQNQKHPETKTQQKTKLLNRKFNLEADKAPRQVTL